MNPARHTSLAKLTQKEVSAAADRHEMLYSGRLGGARASFAYCDLSGLDVAGRNLSDADFTGAILFLANDLLDLFENAKAERKPGVDASGGLPHELGAKHQLVADDLGVGGTLLEDGQKGS